MCEFQTYDQAVAEIEQRIGWTEEQASNCGCNFREEPCDNCWSLGWAIGGIDRATLTDTVSSS